ncbi:MAG: DUF3857 domain-containing protein [Erythrobacter sp.]|nr:DUF3857 domain-containing protein [Erythrobacter sp.]
MQFRTVLGLGLLVSANAALAQSDQVQFGPAPDWAEPSDPMEVPDDASGLVFVRKQDTIVRLTQDGEKVYFGGLTRILHPQALQSGNVQLTWNPAVGAPTVHALRIHRGATVVDVLEQASFEVLRREDQLEAAVLDGQLTAVLRVPDLRIGDDLEIEYTVPSHDPTLASTSNGLLFLGNSTPQGRFQLALSWEEGQEPKTKLSDDFAEIAEAGSNLLAVRLDNPSTITPPKDAPARYGWLRVVEYSDFADWREVSRRFHGLFDNASQLSADSQLRTEAAQIAQAHQSDEARMQAALKLVQQQVRYIYIGLNGGNLTPATAEETWSRRYGDCKGKTALLLALLRELGIEAEAVLASNAGADATLPDRLANPGMFDHVLVRAKVRGRSYWLDGTMPEVIEGRRKPFLSYRFVLPLSPLGDDLVEIEQKPFVLPQVMGIVEIDARAGFDQPAKRSEQTVKRGAAALAEYYQFSALTPDQLSTAFRSALTGEAHWDTIDDVSYRFDRKTQAGILTIKGSGPVSWESYGSDAYSLTLPGGGFYPPSRRLRQNDEEADIPFARTLAYRCYATTVRLPDATDLENWGFNSAIDTMLFGEVFYRMMERRDDRTIRMVRGNRVERTEITPQRAQRDNGRLANFDNTTAVISYNPNEVMEPWGRLHPVPATFEIDWAGEDVPCLPPDMRED